jgi:hypothetical protein
VTKADKWIRLRADEIWVEQYYSGKEISDLKALAQAWKEHHIKSKRGPKRYKLF